jgi:hypothetical protein
MKVKSPLKHQEGFLQPTKEVFRVEGRVSYHEGLGAWGKIVIRKEIVQMFKDLKNKQTSVNYMMAVPTDLSSSKKLLEELYNDNKTIPVFLLFKKNVGADSKQD